MRSIYCEQQNYLLRLLAARITTNAMNPKNMGRMPMLPIPTVVEAQVTAMFSITSAFTETISLPEE